MLGASGLVGSRIRRVLGDSSVGTYRSRPVRGLHLLDVAERADIDDFFDAIRPTAVVLAAAYTHVDGCERDPARSYETNVLGALNVARAATAYGAHVVFLSSDYVFGGDAGPHPLGEAVKPLNIYGQHKLDAERIIAREARSYTILRSCNVYGYERDGTNFVMAVYRNGVARTTMRVPADQWGNPTHADDLAIAVAVAARRRGAEILHVAGPDYVDRLRWATHVAAAGGLDPSFIEAVSTSNLAQAATRPLRAGLDSVDSLATLGVKMRGLDEGLAEVVAALRSGGVDVAQ